MVRDWREGRRGQFFADCNGVFGHCYDGHGVVLAYMYVCGCIFMLILLCVGGTNWFDPNSRRGTPGDEQELDVVAPVGVNHLTSKALFSTTAGPFCYVYA